MGIMSSLFGGSDQKSSSENKSYPWIKDQLAPAVSGGVGSINALNSNLAGGFEGYKKNAGFDFQLGQGLRNTTGTSAAKGLLNSGPAAKAMESFRTGLQGQFYNNFLNLLGQGGQLGLGAAGTIAGAGATSKSSGSSSNGILPTLFSDPRVKIEMRPVGKLDNGLTVYTYRYLNSPTWQIGLNADEVELLHPEAVHEQPWAGHDIMKGKMVKTVDYKLAVTEPAEKEVA